MKDNSEAHHLKIEESYRCMLKVELITNLRGAYYKVDLRIEIFFLQTGCGAIYCTSAPAAKFDGINLL